MSERFDGVIYGVPPTIRSALARLPQEIKRSAEEIRLRAGLPLALTVNGTTLFVKAKGQTSPYIEDDVFSVTQRDVDESFRLLCNNSAFSREEELKNGYLKLDNGCRAGVVGSLSNDGLMQNISCINIRIAREIKGVARNLATEFCGEGWLFAGPPGSGKTTVLRDFVRLISSGISGKIYRVAVVDSRGEISGTVNDLGPATDVIYTEDKARGIEICLRTMFPQVIAFDEIGTVEELNKVRDGFNAGVAIATTAHIGSTAELLSRDVTRLLLQSGAIKRVAVLSQNHSKGCQLYKTEELLNGAI